MVELLAQLTPRCSRINLLSIYLCEFAFPYLQVTGKRVPKGHSQDSMNLDLTDNHPTYKTGPAPHYCEREASSFNLFSIKNLRDVLFLPKYWVKYIFTWWGETKIGDEIDQSQYWDKKIDQSLFEVGHAYCETFRYAPINIPKNMLLCTLLWSPSRCFNLPKGRHRTIRNDYIPIEGWNTSTTYQDRQLLIKLYSKYKPEQIKNRFINIYQKLV